MAARGANVCRVHGGSAPQVKAAAKRRLDQAAEVLTARLLGFALDQGVSDEVALKAVKDALDRAGMAAPKQADVNVTHELKPFEHVEQTMIESGSRSDYRASVGRPDPVESLANEAPPALAGDDHAARLIPLPAGYVLEGEVVESEAVGDGEGRSHMAGHSTPDDRSEFGRQTLANGVLALPAPQGYLPAEEAMAQAAEANRTFRHQLRRR